MNTIHVIKQDIFINAVIIKSIREALWTSWKTIRSTYNVTQDKIAQCIQNVTALVITLYRFGFVAGYGNRELNGLLEVESKNKEYE